MKLRDRHTHCIHTNPHPHSHTYIYTRIHPNITHRLTVPSSPPVSSCVPPSKGRTHRTCRIYDWDGLGWVDGCVCGTGAEAGAAGSSSKEQQSGCAYIHPMDQIDRSTLHTSHTHTSYIHAHTHPHTKATHTPPTHTHTSHATYMYSPPPHAPAAPPPARMAGALLTLLLLPLLYRLSFPVVV